jgi:hypothetical protein
MRQRICSKRDFQLERDVHVLDGTSLPVVIVLQEYNANLRARDVRFNVISMWRRNHNLPFGWMNDTNGKKQACTLSEVDKTDVDANGKVGAILESS